MPGGNIAPRPGRAGGGLSRHPFHKLPNGLMAPRLGMSIAARVVRRAVERNRLRRVIRESFRAHQCELPALDLVIGVRPSAVSAESARLRAALEQLWQKVASTCAR